MPLVLLFAAAAAVALALSSSSSKATAPPSSGPTPQPPKPKPPAAVWALVPTVTGNTVYRLPLRVTGSASSGEVAARLAALGWTTITIWELGQEPADWPRNEMIPGDAASQRIVHARATRIMGMPDDPQASDGVVDVFGAYQKVPAGSVVGS